MIRPSHIFNLLGIILANLLKSCRIRSLDVAPRAFKNSFEIEVSPNSSIDKTSSIGSYTYVGSNTNITKSNIGRYCSIANNVSIGQGEHCLTSISTSVKFYDDPWRTLTKDDCEIASDVWIGVDAVLLRGIKVNFGAVIAANAVVTKDVPAFAIVGGVPAKLIRYRFSVDKQQAILKSRWWEKDKDEAAIAIKKLEVELNML